jgi:hypothetical protein
MCRVPYDFPGDPELAHAMAAAAEKHGTWITAIDDPYLPIFYATVDLWHYLGRGLPDKKWISVSVCQTGDTEDFLRAGRALGDAIAATDRKVLLVASGRCRTPFWPLRQIREHESADLVAHLHAGGARRRPRAHRVVRGRRPRPRARHDAGVPRFKPEAGFCHYLQMIGALGEGAVTAPGRLYGSYENSVGTGQVHVWFDRPAAGWTAPRRAAVA